ncbi:ABC transporter substrate-binding protein [Microbaculum marinum]|uniref:ABC transporter substrate-binding protein n=1 Tax=Microbaculum marinum TaxID=1764581 RepID=A0AAW9RTU1_9HYPH
MKIRTVVFALLAATIAAGLGNAASAETLQVGAYPANPPWENKKEDGSFEGFEVDLVNEIGKRIGAEMEIQDLGFQALFAATSSGRIDMAISSITITNDRLQNQAFTQGYYDSDLALVSSKQSGVSSLADMKGKPIGAISTSTGEKWIQENTEKYGFGDYKGYNTQQDLLLDTQNGRVAGAVGDIAGFQFAFQNMPAMQVVERIGTGDRFAIMMQKGSPLLEKVNAAITEIKKDGTMAALHKKWLGAEADPNTATVMVIDIPQAQ